MAATTTTKPTLALKTPVSATYPSEISSPAVLTPTLLKHEEGEKTPITPPAAYVDFLKTFSPVLMSPVSSSTSSRFNFDDRPTTSRTTSASSTSTQPTSAPSEASENPQKSTSNGSSKEGSSKETAPLSTVTKTKGEMRVTIPPPSPFVRPMSARAPRLRIPPSPLSASVRSPMSVRSLHSPYAVALSPSGLSMASKDSDGSTNRAVSVRQVVTRTVTYSRTPTEERNVATLDPAPKGKKRRIK
ncbi:uncharacterized protein IWZ02DRAFT_386271 [Phyllosticta citriasiana]|uniref:Uncharacterized protein n=1 Tax=Phyllosticta citriasiana TaxID=595635 RepID=A0ABR1KCM6_9PEZI